ncbi:ribbon-helix-helix domain-containing protein [Aquirufa aurantiipilula]
MNKNKRISIRLTETQLRRITDILIEEQITKSQIIREMIEKYLRCCRIPNKSNVGHIINKTKDTNNKTL